MNEEVQWQPARIISHCHSATVPEDPIYRERAKTALVRITPRSGPCRDCGGKTFYIHPEDARTFGGHGGFDVWVCEQDVLTD